MMEDLKNILQDLHPDVDFDSEDRLIEKGILNSFDIVSIIAEIDDVFGVTVPAEEIVLENFNSMQALYSLIERLSEEI